MISVKIDGQTIEVPTGTTVLEATRQAGVNIPTLCNHPELKPYGGCRLCVVEVEGMRTLQASCTLPVFPNMVVQTHTPRVIQARRFILEMLFSERNHFCMYCQKTGGDCELQNAAYGVEMTHWDFQPNWNPYPVDATHPYFVFDHNRCILCRRCVRACAQLVGNHTLSVENRGASCMIVADSGLPMGDSTCVQCGTCVQVCPTGALIDRHSAYIANLHDSEHIKSICIGCSAGCGVEMLVRDNQLVRILGDWEAPVNEGLLCKIGRYWPLEEQRERFRTPMVRKNGTLEPASWNEAFSVLTDQMNKSGGGSNLAAFASGRLPAEVLYAFRQVFADGLNGSLATSMGVIPENLAAENGGSINGLDDLKTTDCVVAFDVDVSQTHPVTSFFIKRKLYEGTQLILIDSGENEMEFFAESVLKPNKETTRTLIGGLLASIIQQNLNQKPANKSIDLSAYDLVTVFKKTGVAPEAIEKVGRAIATAQNPVFIIGSGLEGSQLLASLAEVVDAVMLSPLQAANSRVAYYYGLNRPLNGKRYQNIYLALGDDQVPQYLEKVVNEASFLAIQASYRSPLVEKADVVFPVETWAEQEGHYMNMEGRLQKAHRAVSAPPEVRSNLAVLLELAERLNLHTDQNWGAQLSMSTPLKAEIA